MNIKIQNIQPNFFTPVSKSEIWGKNLILEQNSTCLIKANSGAGKSSFFNFIYGLNNNYNGAVSFDDKNIKSFSNEAWTNIRRKQISIVFQGLNLFPELSVIENIQLKNQLTDYKTEKEIEGYLSILEITPLKNQKASTLSFGQQQRVAIVRSLCQPFNILLLDEPFSHIDTTLIQKAKDLITLETKKRKATLLIASLGEHYNIEYSKTLLL